jgi:phosphatidylglycerol:prolipoprotein diacylglycerol transferase
MSYPFLSDLIRDVTGVDVPLPMPMFGLFVALAVVVAAYFMKRELKRMYEAGTVGPARVREKNAEGIVIDKAVPPQDVVSDFAMVVLFAGIVGARIFHIMEHSDQFILDPASLIFTRSGLSIFGGLIFGTLAGIYCVRRWQLPVRPLLDATAPAMMIGYAIGRIGCQVAGDGDWGIMANMALKPAWLPSGLWAQTYQNNIVGELIPLPGVYPTPMYETAMALLCFGVLWAIRKHPFRMGWLFSVYLILAGVERLLIEQIRVNPVLDVFGIMATQAQMIAVTLIVLGVIGTVTLARRVR